MADRTVKVTLTAVASQYISEFQKAQRQTKQTTDDAKKNLASQKDAMQQVGHAALLMGTVAAAGLAYVVKTTADFDAKMSQVKSLSHATSTDMLALRDAALTAGQGIGFSASQVADAETELVKAGISVKDILGGALPGALQLAAAGQIDVGQATEIATIALTQFNLQGKDVPHVADLLAAGADKALGGVGDLGEALKSGGLVASQFGVSLDETVGTLSAFANAGLLGETAGTDLRQMLLKLGNPSADAAKTMKTLGISIYDASGKFVGISSLAGQLHDKMGNLSEAQRNAGLATIFGSRAIAGANVLYKEGAAGITDWTKKVNDQGFAAQQAAGKMDNLNGDLSKLGAAFQSDIIKSGTGANSVIRDLVQGATALLHGISSLPAPVLGVGVGITAVLAVVGLLGGAFLTIVPKIAATKVALETLGFTGAATKARMASLGSFLTGPWGVALAAAAVGVDLLTKYLDSLQASSSEMTNSLLTATTAQQIFATASKGKDVKWATDVNKDLKDLPAVLQAAADQSSNLFARFDSSHFGAFDALKQIGTQLGTLAQRDLPAAQNAFSLLAAKTDGSQQELWRLLSLMPDYKQALIDQAGAQGINVTSDNAATNQKRLLALAQQQATGSTQDATSATKDSSIATQDAASYLAALSGKADDADGSISKLADALSNLGSGALDVSSATRDFQAAIDDASKAVKDNGKTLDVNTDKGRQNGAALDQIAKSALALASAQVTAGDSAATVTKTMQSGRTAFINAAVAAGKTKDAANRLADQYGLIPKDVATAIKVTGASPASKSVDAFLAKLNSIPSSRVVNILVRGAEGLPQSGGTTHPGYATGGRVLGAGTGTSDSILARLSNGEFISTATATEKNIGALTYINQGGVIPGFANGGPVYTEPRTYVQAPAQYMHAPAAATAGTQVSISMPITAPPNVDPVVIGHVAANSLNGLLRSLP